jgi:DNA topoisomerase II
MNPADVTNDRLISSFLSEEYADSALDLGFRSIASYVDGLKPTSRKVIYTARKLNLTTEMKVSRFAARVADMTQYLHGEGSAEGVTVGLAQSFVGANNIPLLVPEGTFGTRHIPEAAASRYISTRLQPIVKKIFNDDDDPILIEQIFEGDVIEPRYFLPTLPILLVNGSEGVGSGYAQKILPRDPKAIIDTLNKLLIGKKARVPAPSFVGFTGAIEPDENPGSWKILGKFERVGRTKIKVIELPIGYTLASYNKKLDDLEEKHIIKGYEDHSEHDKFLFEVSVSLEFMEHDDDWIIDKLGLIKYATENYTCFDETNTIRVFDSADELLAAYIEMRKQGYVERKKVLLSRWGQDRKIAEERARFIRYVIKGTLKLSGRPVASVERDLENDEKPFLKVDDSYDYLLSMPMRSLTKEKAEELEAKAEAARLKVSELKAKTEVDLWADDLKSMML